MEKYPNYIMIEKEVLLNNNLVAEEKLLYAYISALSNNDKKICYASNSYLGKLLNKSPRQIRRFISNLKKYNYVTYRMEHGKRLLSTTLDVFITKRESGNIKKLFEYDWLNDLEEREM